MNQALIVQQVERLLQRQKAFLREARNMRFDQTLSDRLIVNLLV
jgi:hypothetical protein